MAFARPYANWPSDITEALNEFYSHFDSLQVKYEQRFVAGLTMLNSFTWEHSLDNASASLEGNTPSPQDGNNIRADYAQSDYNLPIANVTSLVYELPFGQGRQFLSDANPAVDSILGGWQISGINTAQAGTPFNVTYSPNSAQAVSPQISATYRGANEYRPDHVPAKPITQGIGNRAANTGYINYINPSAFVLPPIKDGAGSVLSPFGNASRNPGRGQAFYQTDLALNKKFATPIESLKVEFRTEFYNIFNHTNLYLPGTISVTQGTTSQTFSTGATPPLSAITPGAANVNSGQITSDFGAAHSPVCAEGHLLNAPSSKWHWMGARAAPISFPPAGGLVELTTMDPDSSGSPERQIADLRARVMRLEAALRRRGIAFRR